MSGTSRDEAVQGTRFVSASEHRTWQGGPSTTFANRLARAAFQIVWLLLASWTPPFLHGWRRQILRLFGARMAPTARVYSSARIWAPWNLELDDYACIGPNATAYSMALISLGPYSIVSQGVYLAAGTHDTSDPDFQILAKPIRVGARAWLAAQAFVGPGVTVGEGAVLGARGCAFRDLDPWTVYVGNPAKPLKKRVMCDRPAEPREN